MPIYVRKSTLRLPYRSTCPVIMVGPGTGLAPFRGFIEDRCMTKKDGECVNVLYSSECLDQAHCKIFGCVMAGKEPLPIKTY